MNKSSLKYAFSLVELSIVILIIAGIVGSLVGANNMIKRARLEKARSATSTSLVKSMDGLVLWYDATTEQSIGTLNNSSNINAWHDLGPNKIDASQSTSVNQPQYIENAINKLPAIRFDGSTDFMTFTGNAIANNNYTIIILEQRSSNKNNNYFLGGTGTTTNSNLYLGYSDDSHIIHAQTNNNYTLSTSLYNNTPKPKLHIFTHNCGSGKKYYQNAGLVGSNADGTTLVSYAGSAIGRMVNGSNSYYYQGDIGEIIIFNRAISDSERTNIENYLIKKWDLNTNYS